MIKQTWNVDIEEKLRILNLHESATKNLYLTNEQTKIVTGIDTKIENKTFPLTKLGDKFGYGEYDSPVVKSELEKLKPQIEGFIKAGDSSNFVVNISAGESRVTNPKGFETTGSLALARANSIKKYFEEIFPEQIKNGVLTIKLPASVRDVKIGETPYGGKGSGDFNDVVKKEKYRQEQFVDFDIVGTGKKTVKTPITKTLCNTQPKQSAGGYILSNYDFTQTVNWEIGEGEGSVTLTTDAINMPDIIYFEYDGKTYGDTMFRGYNTEDLRIFIGTSLMAKYGNGQLPPQFGKNTIETVSRDVVKNNLNKMKEWGLAESFINTFGSKSSLNNPDYMSAFAEFDKTGNKNKLLNNLGENFPWARLSSNIENPVGKIGPIKKIEGINIIKVINVSPVGTTKWNVYLQCNSNQ